MEHLAGELIETSLVRLGDRTSVASALGTFHNSLSCSWCVVNAPVKTPTQKGVEGGLRLTTSQKFAPANSITTELEEGSYHGFT